jgi:hypothetical protein
MCGISMTGLPKGASSSIGEGLGTVNQSAGERALPAGVGTAGGERLCAISGRPSHQKWRTGVSVLCLSRTELHN